MFENGFNLYACIYFLFFFSVAASTTMWSAPLKAGKLQARACTCILQAASKHKSFFSDIPRKAICARFKKKKNKKQLMCRITFLLISPMLLLLCFFNFFFFFPFSPKQYFSGYFDTTSGGKTVASSYTTIASAIDVPAKDILFYTDNVNEARAAVQAGLCVCVCVVCVCVSCVCVSCVCRVCVCVFIMEK